MLGCRHPVSLNGWDNLAQYEAALTVYGVRRTARRINRLKGVGRLNSSKLPAAMPQAPGFLALSLGTLSVLEGKPYIDAARINVQTKLRQALIKAPAAFDSIVGGTIVVPRPVHCRENQGQKEFDVEFLVFTTKIPFSVLPTLEHQGQEASDPSQALALAPVPGILRIIPQFNYDASQGFLSGGRLAARLPHGTALTLEGQGSSEALSASTTVSGLIERDKGWVRRIDWRGAYAYANRPSDSLRLKSSRGIGQLTLTTATLPRFNGALRVGTMVDGGSQSTGYVGQLPENVVAGSLYADWRSYVGFTFRRPHHSFSASFGVLLGRTGMANTFDYHKVIEDVAYETQFRLLGSRSFLESRFTAGKLGGSGPIPISERIFGGNAAIPFIPGDDWTLLANPVVRGIPANRFNRNTVGGIPGGTSFVGMNLTLAIPVYSIPLIPDEASKDAEIREKVNNLLDSGVEILDVLNETADPAQQDLFQHHRQSFIEASSAMQNRVAALESSIPESLKGKYQTCNEKIGDLEAQAEDISRSTPWRNFIKDDPEESTIPTVLHACLDDLNSSLKDVEIDRLGKTLKEQQKVITEKVDQIDSTGARTKAEQSMKFPREVIRATFDELKVVSVAPLATFDMARIGPNLPSVRAVRYSPGGGIRFIVASSVSFDLGYAWNLQPRPWEGRGALFFGIRFLNLFGK